METKEKNSAKNELVQFTIDISRQALKKIERANSEQKEAYTLVLNDNEIQRLDNLDTYKNLKKLFLVNNQLIRMCGVSSLINLEVLDLTNNSLMTIEGLKDLKNLKELVLAKNKIRTIEHLNNNLKLQKVDLSENAITHISDVSYLENLKEFYLHSNKIIHLRQCEKNLPMNIEILTLHNNMICDLNEVSHLVQFNFLRELSFLNNPCVNFTKQQNKFNYRPFVKNWCSNLIVLDSHPLDDIECLQAEWLYSQGRGRSFHPGEQAALIEYLISTCPVKQSSDETEDIKKLKLILSKAQQHQKQLKEQLSSGDIAGDCDYKIGKNKKVTEMQEKMVKSFQGPHLSDRSNSPDFMSKSLDSGLIKNSPGRSDKGGTHQVHQTPLKTSTKFIPIPDSLISPDVLPAIAPFLSPTRTSISNRTSRSSSKNSTPECKREFSVISNKQQNEPSSPLLLKKHGKPNSSRRSFPLEEKVDTNLLSSPTGCNAQEVERKCRETSDEEFEIMSKSSFVEHRLNAQKSINKKHWKRERDQFQMNKHASDGEGDISVEGTESMINATKWKAAICIQRRWRGYRARNLNREVLNACKDIQLSRIQEYIMKVISEMEAARIALEGNRKLQILQMQAINALWKKIITIQPHGDLEYSRENNIKLQDLIEVCSNLKKQVEGLQAMVKDIQNNSVPTLPSYKSSPIATQTEIEAVHAKRDDEESFVFKNTALSNIVSSYSDISSVETQNITKEPDVMESYTIEDVEGSLSSEKSFSVSKFQDEKELK